MADDKMSLRERKQRRTREAIIEAAMTLFADRGFDDVTVTEIAERAEVGRTTFFRYFADKKEVLFADDDKFMTVLTEAMHTAAAAPIGDSLADAVRVARDAMLALAAALEQRAQWLPVRDRLIAESPALTARNQVKEREYRDRAVQLLVEHGATLDTAVLAVGVATACYWTAQVTTAKRSRRTFPAAVNAAFERLSALDLR